MTDQPPTNPELAAILALLADQPIVLATTEGNPLGMTTTRTLHDEAMRLSLELAVRHTDANEITNVLMGAAHRVGLEGFQPVLIGALNALLTQVLEPALAALDEDSEFDLRAILTTALENIEAARQEPTA